ncbi:MAG TPA: molybdopterin-dependent oxidoreductase [Isosphaeraceae bacterium]|jgi:DMSO/TMAO reductase YedYZ molybdopterin-dependent catalytic subunit|nr:molybdopterin-dependent oxidoreductase [Isosphaeraceae bacterium]
MERPLDQQPMADLADPRENNMVECSADVRPASPLAADGTPTPQVAIRPIDSTIGLTRPDGDLERRLHRLSRRGFALGGAAALAGVVGWRWLVTRGEEGGLAWPLRRALEFDERLARGLFRQSSLSPQFPRSAARMPRVNGSIGLDANLDQARWRLQVIGSAGEHSPQSFTLDQIRAFPRVEMTTELRCIEGWSDVVHWAGARLANLASVTGLATHGARRLGYAALQTPDGQYYVGLDMASALHPQTLLCYEMDGRPLTPEHGAPLRLVIPVKYGIKNLKQIGTIRFTDVRPADYWAEQGYDWYAGL